GFGGYGAFPAAPPLAGLSHTGTLGSPFGSPFAQPGFPGPMGSPVVPGLGATPFGQVPSIGNPFFQPMSQGLSHSTGAWGLPGFAPGIHPYALGSPPIGAEGIE